jgi:hypothetical protein
MKGVITKNSQTVNYFTRHEVIKLKLTYPDVETGEMLEEWHRWKVVATDKYSSDSVMEVYLKEWYDNEIEDYIQPIEEDQPSLMEPHIEGPAIVKVFDTDLSFSIVGLSGGEFVVNSNKVKIKNATETSCLIDILTSKASNFELQYKIGDEVKAKLKIIIKSF